MIIKKKYKKDSISNIKLSQLYRITESYQSEKSNFIDLVLLWREYKYELWIYKYII